MKGGQVAEAARAFEQITRRRPEFAEAHFALGVADIQLGKPGEAAAALRSYLKLEPGSPDGHAVLGILLFNEGRLAEARPERPGARRRSRARRARRASPSGWRMASWIGSAAR